MTGTIIAQVISYLITPILTRIYSTEEMGELGIYLRIVGFISVLATARYEMSLPLPKNDSHSFLLYRVSFRIALFSLLGSAILGVIYLVFRQFGLNDVLFVFISVLSALFVVLINIGTNWSIRNKHFTKISNTRITASLTTNAFRWVFGVFHFGSIGLLLASLIGYILSSISFVREFFELIKSHKSNKSKQKTYVLLKEYKQFPSVSLPHSLVDLGSDLLIATLIVTFFSKDIFGSYSHSFAILKLPLVVIGAAISQVFFGKCSQMVNEGKSIARLLKKTLITLFFLSIIPFTVIFFYGEELFAFVFGEKWASSGHYSEIMTIWLMTNFLVSPVSSIPMIINRQKEFFVFGITSACIQLFSFGVLPLIWGTSDESFIAILWFASIVQAAFFVFVAFATLYYAKLGVVNKSV